MAGGVNVAARLESLAEPGGILISGTAYDHVEGKLDCGFKYLGEKEVKNIERPVRAYRVLLDQGVGSPSAMPIVGGGRHWWSGAGVAAAILVLLGTADWLQPWQSLERAAVGLGSEASALNPRRLAVLPFADISAEAENEYFSDGLTEELISQLSRIRELSVIARTSVIGYKGTDKRIDEIGRELDAGTILEGSVRKAGNQVRIMVQLIDTASQAHLWSEDYSRQFEDIFAIQAEIAKHVADTLKVTLLASTRDQISRQPTENLEAYNFYLRGRHFLNQYTKEGLHKAMEYFEQALVKDPKLRWHMPESLTP
jgi:adenylate cyclase